MVILVYQRVTSNWLIYVYIYIIYIYIIYILYIYPWLASYRKQRPDLQLTLLGDFNHVLFSIILGGFLK